MKSFRHRLRWLVDPGTNLGRRAANAGAWAFLLNLSNKLLTLVRTVVLARLLAPSDFGLMGIAMLVIGLLQTFTQTGFAAALVQRKGDLEVEYLNAAWTIEVIRGASLAALMFFGAPVVSDFFEAPEALGLTRLLAVGLLVNGLSNVGVVSFDRDLAFQRRFAFRSVPNVVDLVVSVTLAIAWGTPWALAFGWVAARFAGTLASYVAHSFRPHLRWDPVRIRELFRFGIWMLGSQILVYFTLNVDDIVVGRVLGTTALGLYQMAFTLSQLTTTEITAVINQVAFPTYSKLQGQLDRLRVAYLTTVQLVAFLSFPVTAGLWFVGEELVETFLGSRWLPLVPAFNVLLIWGLIRSLLATTGPLLRGVGKPEQATKIQMLQLVLLAIVIGPLTSRYGIVGAGWATVAAAIVPDVWALQLASKEASASFRSLGRVLAFPAVNTILMTAVLHMGRLSNLLEGTVVLVWAPAIGAATYLGLTLVARRWFGYAPTGLLGGVNLK